jgi:glycosyltransferase involved in cell wall biosynthesis
LSTEENYNIGVSIVICTYNGTTRLADTLSHLSQQIIRVPVELILVDNASSDGAKHFADEWWKQHGNPKIHYKSFEQPLPGKSYAQEMGYSNSSYEYLLVCDDDNWLAPHYVQTAYEIMNTNDQIGALGGWCEAVFENAKPEWFDTYALFYAVSKQGTKSGDVTHKKGCLYGAGMVIRKSHWKYLNELGFQPLLTCRKGNTLASGGDTEYSYVLRLLGYKMWYDERLYFKHYIPTGRMNLDYVLRIRKAMSTSNFVVSIYTDKLKGKKRTQGGFMREFLNQIRHYFLKNLKMYFSSQFDSKERSKEYFRKLKRLLFSYKNYKHNYNSMDTWLTKK